MSKRIDKVVAVVVVAAVLVVTIFVAAVAIGNLYWRHCIA